MLSSEQGANAAVSHLSVKLSNLHVDILLSVLSHSIFNYKLRFPSGNGTSVPSIGETKVSLPKNILRIGMG